MFGLLTFEADLVEVGGEVVGGDLEAALGARPLPGERTPGLRPPAVLVVAGAEGPAVTETAVLSTLGSAARQHRGGLRPQSDHVVRDSLQLKPGVSLVGHRAQAGLLRLKTERTLLLIIKVNRDKLLFLLAKLMTLKKLSPFF